MKLIPDTSAGYSAALLPGSYVLSAYISSSALAKKAGTDGGFSLRVLNSAGTVAGSDRVSGIKGDGWVRVFLPFTVAEAGDYTLSLSSTDTEGTVYADCVQLENGSVPTTFNAIQNSGFEDGTTGWNGGSAGGAVISGQGSIAVAPGSEAYRTVSLYSPSKRSFMLSGYAYSASGKATGVSLGITYNYSDGTSSAEVFPFTDYITGAQFASYSAVSEKFSDSLTIDSVKIALHNGSGETVCFDDILLSFGDTVSDDGGEEEDTGSYTSGLSFASQGPRKCLRRPFCSAEKPRGRYRFRSCGIRIPSENRDNRHHSSGKRYNHRQMRFPGGNKPDICGDIRRCHKDRLRHLL